MSEARRSEVKRIDELAEGATADFLRRSSLTYLECCIAVMLTHLDHEEVAEILEREAKDLREFG
ncbi:hypothetical protein MesoLj113c_44740 [Mesorhizobium sp. 113-3-9]|uniref:hypothetical protein n=1 Tax=Mesorhizobium sp. 113-3-9 TaxID=2744517 RepID=UPI0019290D75|nr:hypothetical protein [Mesorhizobium sp. 113-3-9]BCG88364.1 hypothetical protein MesoLj113c_44740 [Mesorhizobium sp. 113-3-9]